MSTLAITKPVTIMDKISMTFSTENIKRSLGVDRRFLCEYLPIAFTCLFFVCLFSGAVPSVRADGAAAVSEIGNLLKNALKYILLVGGGISAVIGMGKLVLGYTTDSAPDQSSGTKLAAGGIASILIATMVVSQIDMSNIISLK